MARELRDRYAHISYLVEDLKAVQEGRNPPNASPRLEAGEIQNRQLPTGRLRLGLRLAGLVLILALGGFLWKSNKPSSATFTGQSGSDDATGVLIRTNKPSSVTFTNPLQLAWPIDRSGVWDWSGASLGRFNKKGPPALYLPHERDLVIISSQGQRLGHWTNGDPYAKILTILLRTNINADAGTETILSYRSVSNVVVSVLNDTPKEIHRLPLPATMVDITNTITGPVCDSNIEEGIWADLEGNGHPVFLTLIHTGYGLQPRGLICADLPASKVLWTNLTGPNLRFIHCLDFNGDGRQEIIGGSQATGNGNIASDGTSDKYSYLFAFNSKGETLWKRQLGDIYTLVHPLILSPRSRGQPEIFAWLEGYTESSDRNGYKDIGRIYRFNSSGKITGLYNTYGIALISCRAVDLNGDGREEILATDRQGFLRVLDADLNLKQTIPVVAPHYERVKLILWAVADINGDHKPELVFGSVQEEFISGINPGNTNEKRPERAYHQMEIVVLNQEMTTIARYPLADYLEADQPYAIAIADMDEDGQNEIVYCADKVRILKWQSRGR